MNKIKLFLIVFVSISYSYVIAQTPVKEPQKINAADKSDMIAFHRQIITLKQYAEERSKIPALKKLKKVNVKVSAVIDTVTSDTDEAKSRTLTGYIKQEIGDTAANVYEITFDRVEKKIIAIKRTGEGEDVESKEEKAEDAKIKATKKVTPVKKKKEDDEDDDDKDEENGSKQKQKDKDDDKDE